MLNLVLAAALSAHPPAATCANVKKPFVGTICSPHGNGKHPAMILLGGSEGGNSMAPLAKVFAAHGYVAASVAYFGEPGTQAGLGNVPGDTVKRAIAALTARPDVDAAHIGILGVSKGGEFALLAASTYPQIKAVVAIVPSPIAYMGLGQGDIPTGCSWSRDGKPLPCVAPDAAAGMAIGAAAEANRPIVLKPLYDASRGDDAAATKAAFFPLERSAGPVLCLAGADDQMWNSPEHCNLAMHYLKAHHHPYADAAVSYPNAGHLFAFAVKGPQSAVISTQAPGGPAVEFGGTPQGDADAATKAWRRIWTFLAASLP